MPRGLSKRCSCRLRRRRRRRVRLLCLTRSERLGVESGHGMPTLSLAHRLAETAPLASGEPPMPERRQRGWFGEAIAAEAPVCRGADTPWPVECRRAITVGCGPREAGLRLLSSRTPTFPPQRPRGTSDADISCIAEAATDSPRHRRSTSVDGPTRISIFRGGHDGNSGLAIRPLRTENTRPKRIRSRECALLFSGTGH